MPNSVYRRARARALERGQEWGFDYDSWVWLWQNAPRVYDARHGYYVTAWSLKGGNYNTDTQMCRIDPEGPWSVDNCFIALRGHPLEEPEDAR